MKTSEIIECLKGEAHWAAFGSRYKEALSRMVQRNDGAITSGDIGLIFDETLILDKEHLSTMGNLGVGELWTFANLVALCGFEARSNVIEEILFTMCEHAGDA